MTTSTTDAGTVARDLGPLVALGMGEDRVSFSDGPVAPDGLPDYRFRVRVSGDASAMLLAATDAQGHPTGGELWDTIRGDAHGGVRAIAGIDGPLHDGWTLAVVDAAGRVLNPLGTLPPTVFADETLVIHVGADPGHFAAGRIYTLFVIRRDGHVDRTTTTLL